MRDLIVTLAIGLVIGWTANDLRLNYQIQRIMTAQMLEREAHIMVTRKEEQRRLEEIEKVQNDAQKEIERIMADAVAADRTADGLQRELAAARGRLATCSGSAGGGEAARDTGVLLTELLDEMERAGRAVAAEADRRGVAGRACEAAYATHAPAAQ